MIKIETTGEFIQLLNKLYLEDPRLESLIAKKVNWFQKNSKDTRLENHPLSKRMRGKWSFSITEDIRIVYKWTNKTTVRLLDIGPHIKVYVQARAKKQSPKR